MDGLRVSPARTQLFHVQASTMEEAMQVTLQEEYSHTQAQPRASAWQGHSEPTAASASAPGNGAGSGPAPMDLGIAEQKRIRCFECGRFRHVRCVCPSGGQWKRSSKPQGSKGRWKNPAPKSQGNAGGQ
ncbi:hypothetical protein P3T76_012721 [Phytophthora citrophthora]|uniref:CCHC-type domain-containing protein n=1 Tax=Phytophthora citrophthora TaxID=4793 RepID=A0AAD9G479_9STRA|nr:hypothetical protein P3T76_012721 [Phytophthora citrophthora]